MDKTILFTGINRSLPSQLTPDGACQEIVNLRLRKGAWRPVGHKKLYRELEGDNFSFIVDAGITDVFLHDIDNGLVAGEPNWIVYNLLTGQLSLVNFSSRTLTALDTLPPSTAIKVVFLKRTLIVTCETSLSTYLWSSDHKYTKFSTLPVPDVTVSVKPDTTKTLESEHGLLVDNPKGILASYLTEYNNENKLDGSSFGSILYIAAYRLFDGNYILPSIPKHLEISNKGEVTVFILHTESDGQILPPHGTFYFDTNLIEATVKDLYSGVDLEATKDLIDSVCVFATPLTPLHRIDEYTFTEETLIKVMGLGGGGGTRTLPYRDLFPVSDDFRNICKSPSFYKIHEFSFDSLVSGNTDIKEDVDLKDYYHNYATRDSLTTDQFTHHSIHSRVAMVYNDRLHLYNIRTIYGLPYIQWQTPPGMKKITETPGTLSVWLKTNLGQVVVNAPVMVPRYADESLFPDDYDPDTPVTQAVLLEFDHEYAANNFIAWLENDPASKGYPNYVPGSATPERITPIEGDFPRVTLLFFIYTGETLGDEFDESVETYFYLPGIIGYNDARAYKMQLVVGSQNGFLFEDKLTKNQAMNYAFWCNPLFSPNEQDPLSNFKPQSWAFSESLILGSVPAPLSTGFDTNRLQVSEIQNPLIFPTKYSYQVGTGDGLALAAGSEPLSTGQFGQFPLQAFSSKGIWALEISSPELLYSNILPVNGEVINNPRNVIPIGGGVIYTTERGLFLLLGREVQELSDVVEGVIDLKFIQLPELQGIVSGVNFISLSDSLSQIPFLSYLTESRIGYDHLNRELVITRSDKEYSYVFSFESVTWSKISPTYSLLVNAYPALLGFTLDSCVNLSQEQEEGYIDCLVITRPLSLDLADMYKKIERCVLRSECLLNQGRYAGWYLFASDDLNTWQFITGIQRTGFPQDFLFQRSNGSAKYYILVFAASIAPSSEISRLDVTFVPRWNLKLR